ncbi:MAG: hypothetical protein A2157_07825 [Deltaproteobacteria bacterium RBG_16_47_11]|nr:MAG: hypothetical protein A2157_07825 [Deltaproteobacteria bacterium RBG_16_47_11]
MNLREITPRPFVLILPFVLLLVFGCSTPSWFPIKLGSSHKAKMKELLDKEVVIIDKAEYVKVLNPKASDGKGQPKYLYVPVKEYLSNKESFTAATMPIEGLKKESSVTPTKPSSPSLLEEETLAVSPSKLMLPRLKKKVLITYFDDRTTQGEEVFGDWVAEKLMKEVNRRTLQVLFADYQMVKEFFEKKGTDLKNLETSKGLQYLNEVFGVHALVAGELSGPYVFTTETTKDQESTASAIIKIDMRLVDTFTGKTVKNLSANNPIIAAKEKGSFSEEKAKVKAIDVTIANLGRSLAKELDGMDWFCRIAKVEGEEVYMNAGRLTGLQVGDVMEVFRPGGSGEPGEVKGKIRISAFFGIDASMGRLIQGKNPDVNDILKLAKRDGI